MKTRRTGRETWRRVDAALFISLVFFPLLSSSLDSRSKKKKERIHIDNSTHINESEGERERSKNDGAQKGNERRLGG